MGDFFSLDDIRATRTRLGDRIHTTPVWQWQDDLISARVGTETDVFVKLELLQHTGSFKARGALNNLLSLDADQRGRGVTAVSAGNHAVAVAWAAQSMGASAKVVMFKGANPLRVQKAREYGAEIVIAESAAEAFERAAEIQQTEGRAFVHPFEGETTALGTATVGLEFIEQAADLDAVIVPIGGGGLIAGMAAAIKQARPTCKVYGVEPEGADSMSRSFAAGSPQRLERINTIADSLGAPMALPYSYALCREYVDEIVLISDDAMREAMRLLFFGLKLAVEPACAAATAGLVGPLLEKVRGKRVGVIACGANIDIATFTRLVNEG
jgi:threonine dehydratase